MKNGTINAENQSCVSISGQNSEDYTDTNKKNSFVMNGGTLEGYNGVAMFEGATKFSMTNGSITSTGDSGAAVSVSDESSGSTIEISGGTVKATGESAMAVDNESYGTAEIKGGSITAEGEGSTAVYNGATGTVEISGGTVKATSDNSTAASNDSSGTVNISGGEISTTGKESIAVYNGSSTDDEGTSSPGKLNISGEDTTINGAVCNSSGEVNISEDSTTNGFITNEEGTVKVGSTNLEELTNMATVLIDGEEQSFLNDDNKNAYIEANCVAIIGTAGEDDAQYFTTLEAAVDAAKENNTITLLKDVKLNGTIIIDKDNVNTNEYENSFIINKDITLDLDEYDLTITDTDGLDCVIQILSGILTITG